jgi:Tol biopolymer transport system component
LWISETESDELIPLMTGMAEEDSPAISPDGQSIVYMQREKSLDVVSLSIEDGTAKSLVSAGREDSDPAWSAKQERFAWVTNRSGPWEIWVRLPDGSDRPVVTAADFPAGPAKWLMTPSLSPDGERLIFTRVDNAGIIRLWISSLSGGSPVRLTNEEAGSEFGGSWSPDGSRFVYLHYSGGKELLTIVKTSGGAAPVVLKDLGNDFYLPEWSPAGEWITYCDDKGWSLISPDGKNSKFLGKIETPYLAFSKDGKRLYGIQTGENEADRDRATLFSLDLATLKQRVVKELSKDLLPARIVSPDIRFSLAPDGKSFVYSTSRHRTDLWMLQVSRQPG